MVGGRWGKTLLPHTTCHLPPTGHATGGRWGKTLLPHTTCHLPPTIYAICADKSIRSTFDLRPSTLDASRNTENLRYFCLGRDLRRLDGNRLPGCKQFWNLNANYGPLSGLARDLHGRILAVKDLQPFVDVADANAGFENAGRRSSGIPTPSSMTSMTKCPLP